MQTVGLNTHIWNNNFKSVILLAGFPVLLLFLLWMFGALLAFSSGQDVYMSINAGAQLVYSYGHWMILAALMWFAIAWFFQTRLLSAAAGAREVTRQDEPELYNILENLCISRGLTMPVLQIIDSPGLNAFASGINEGSYRITFTRGLIDKLDEEELKAVMAHELTHIINRDVRLLVVSVIFVGMIGFMAQFAFRHMIYGSMYRHRNRRSDPRIMIIALVVLTMGYIFSILIRFALSRSREYMADAGAVELTKNPEAMMNALLKISGNDYVEETPADIEQMCIENSHKFMGLFATHPPIEKRIEAISSTTGTPVPRPGENKDKELNKGQNPWVENA